MKKAIAIIVLGLLLSTTAYAGITELSESKIKYPGYDRFPIGTVCVDDYKFVIVRAPQAVSIVQVFEEKNGRSVPSKC